MVKNLKAGLKMVLVDVTTPEADIEELRRTRQVR
jgi:hypothetical protein